MRNEDAGHTLLRRWLQRHQMPDGMNKSVMSRVARQRAFLPAKNVNDCACVVFNCPFNEMSGPIVVTRASVPPEQASRWPGFTADWRVYGRFAASGPLQPVEC